MKSLIHAVFHELRPLIRPHRIKSDPACDPGALTCTIFDGGDWSDLRGDRLRTTRRTTVCVCRCYWGGVHAPAKSVGKALPEIAPIIAKIGSKFWGKIAGAAAGEGFEEAISSETQRLLDNGTFEEDTPFSLKDLLYQMGVGSAMGSLLGGGVHGIDAISRARNGVAESGGAGKFNDRSKLNNMNPPDFYNHLRSNGYRNDI